MTRKNIPNNLLTMPQTAGPDKKKKPKGLMPDGRIRVTVDVGYDDKTGKRKQKAFYGATLKEAQAAANEYRRAIEEGRDVEGARQTVAKWARTWYETYGNKAGYSTNTTNEILVRRIEQSMLGKKALIDVRNIDIQNFANEYAKYSLSYVSSMKSVMNRMFKKAISNRTLQLNPCDSIIWEHAKAGTHRALEPWEVSLINKWYGAHRAGIWVMLMLYAGLRRGEALVGY